MAEATSPSPPARSLRAATNPQARMQELLQRDAAPTQLDPLIDGNSYDNMTTDNMTPNMTSHMTENLTDKQTEPKTNNKVSQPESKPTRKQTIKQESQLPGQSVADMIRQRADRRAEQEVLKTVTLKLSPSLDEKIERYCFDHKMKKQEFWAEAAALYFELVGDGGENQ